VRRRRALALLAAGVASALGRPAAAHITPPVVLVSDRDAVVALLAGARRFFVREVRLTGPERDAIRARSGWTPEEDLHRFYIGRDAEGRLVAAVIFLTEFTIHGPVRVAAALGPDGRVRGAMVVELTEETYGWVKPLIDRDFTRRYVGLAAAGPLPEPPAAAESMGRFYGQIVGALVRRAALLLEEGVLKRGDAA